jgi:hypothetical protein
MASDPEYGTVDGWWQPHRFYRLEQSTLDHEIWCIHDHHFTPTKPLPDWRSKGVRKPCWKGTKKEAFDLARLLNAGGKDSDRITKTQTSLTQVRAFQQDKARRTRPARGAAGPPPQFKKCHCGAYYKGESHCAE